MKIEELEASSSIRATFSGTALGGELSYRVVDHLAFTGITPKKRRIFVVVVSDEDDDKGTIAGEMKAFLAREMGN